MIRSSDFICLKRMEYEGLCSICTLIFTLPYEQRKTKGRLSNNKKMLVENLETS